MAVETKTGIFLNESTGTVQEIHSEYDVEILEIGLLSADLCRVVIEGEKSAINELLTVVNDPRNPPEEPEEPEEPIDPEA